MRAVLSEDRIFLTFSYDEDKIARIKSIPGRRYDPETKSWSVPVSRWKDLLDKFDVTEGLFYPGEPLNRKSFFALAVTLREDRLEVQGPAGQKNYLYRSLMDLCGYDDKEPKTLVSIEQDVVFFPKGLYWRIKNFLVRFFLRRFEIAEMSSPPEPVLNLEAKLDARPYQLKALEMLKGINRATIVLPTGAGKTALAAMLTAQLKVPTIFYTYSVDLALQTRKVFEEILRIPVGIVAGGKTELRPVTVSTVQTVFSRLEAPEIKGLLSECALMFVDEGHMLGAETIYKVSKMTDPYYAYALTATPERRDGKDILIEAGAGPVIVIEQDKKLSQEGYILPVEVVFYKISQPPNNSTRYRALYKRHILNFKRTRFIAEVTKTLSGRILVLVKEIKHGEDLAELLKAPFVHGKTPVKEREEVFEAFRKGEFNILIASNVAKQGIDLPEAEILVMAHGGSSKTEILQKIGRVRRPAPGKEKALVIDFLDVDGGFFEKLAKKRASIYKAAGFKLTTGTMECTLNPPSKNKHTTQA